MIATDRRSKLFLEFMLINIVLGMTMLFVVMGEHRLMALNLFYLPVIISGYFLGRFCAGVLALFAALLVTIATLVFPTNFVALDSAVGIALTLTLWSAILGLAAILVGTLCDERAATVKELQRAYVGIAEVLSRYLQGLDPKKDSQTRRVACLSQRIAEELRLPPRDVDDIRVAALLHDLSNIEISTQVISRAVNSLENGSSHSRRTFMGTDLVQSLGEVLQGALPLLVNQDDGVYNLLSQQRNVHEIPFGVHVIRAARTFDQMAYEANGQPLATPREVLLRMRTDADGPYQLVIDALARIVVADDKPSLTRRETSPVAAF